MTQLASTNFLFELPHVYEMREILIKQIPQLVKNIKDELLSSGLIVIILGISLPEAKFWVFIVWSPLFIVYTYLKLKAINVKSDTVMELFTKYLDDPSNWEKRFEKHQEYWVYKSDPLFQITIGEEMVHNFQEPWMKNYPDMEHNYSFKVYLKYMDTIVDDLVFVALDGHRYVVPLPEIEVKRGKRTFFYKEDSLKAKTVGVIGFFYRYKSFKDFIKVHNLGTK